MAKSDIHTWIYPWVYPWISISTATAQGPDILKGDSKEVAYTNRLTISQTTTIVDTQLLSNTTSSDQQNTIPSPYTALVCTHRRPAKNELPRLAYRTSLLLQTPGVYHYENSQMSGNLTKQILAISAKVRREGRGSVSLSYRPIVYHYAYQAKICFS